MTRLPPLRARLSDRTFAVLAGGVSLAVLVLVVRRAAAVPLTYDEAASYLRYIDTDLMSVFNFDVATNHLFVTLLTRIAHAALGDSEFALRLPSVLGYVLFSGSAYLIALGVTHRSIALAGFTLLHLNPYLLDFFALSRGYGLSLGFLMASLHLLLRFLASREDARAAPTLLSWCLVAAAAAVLSNFAMLNAYLAVVIVITVSPITRRVSQPRARLDDQPESAARRWRRIVIPASAGAMFAVIVFSQDADLARGLYERVVVRVGGLDERAADAVRLFRLDLRGRAIPLVRDDAAWSAESAAHFSGIRIEMPQAIAAQAAFVEVAIGDRLFWDRMESARHWTSDEQQGQRILESTAELSLPRPRNPGFKPVINWAGERRHLQVLLRSAVLVFVLLTATGVALEAIGVLGGRLGLLRRREWRPIQSSLLWIAACAGSPLYVLKRGGELHFGAPTLVATFTSLSEGFFYGKVYFMFQEALLLAVSAAAIGGSCWLLRARYHGQRTAALDPSVVLLSLMLLVSLSLVAQHVLFSTPYLSGRTALLYVPLYLLLVMFLCRDAADHGPRVRRVTTLALWSIVGLSSAHMATVVNTRYVLDWRDDAATRMMIGDVRELAAQTNTPAVILGVERQYFPVAVYYARQTGGIEVDVLPNSGRVDYVYRRIGRVTPNGRVIARYPVAGSLLAVEH